MKRKILNYFLILILLNLAFANPISSPHAFYGNVLYNNGSLVSEGKIIAKINGIEKQSQEFLNGTYGYEKSFIVEGNPGEIIEFYIDGEDNVLAKVVLEFGQITNLNFTINVTPQNNSFPAEEGRRKSVQYIPKFYCEPNWQCSGWGECSEGIKTRVCKDSNRCEFSYNKPNEKTGCEIISSLTIKEEKFNWEIFLTATFLALLSALILLFWQRSK